MPIDASSVLEPWSGFYVIIGSSAAALTGLMFVVITLVAGLESARRSPDGISTFSTPTVAHFCVALLVSAALSAPWHSLSRAAWLFGVVGACGVAYVLGLTRRSMRLTIYEPEVEDWIWYTILPLVAYATVGTAAIYLPTVPAEALWALAGAVVLLTFIGIHNAWDIVTYLVVVHGNELPPVNPPAPEPPTAPQPEPESQPPTASK